MPLEFHPREDLFSTSADAIVITVNTVGFMGKGIALECRRRWPHIDSVYRESCHSGRISVGKLLWVPTNSVQKPNVAVLFPTKKHYRNPSQIAYITAGLRFFVDHVDALPYRNYAFPPLGCGHGGLDWAVVREHLVRFLHGVAVDIHVHADAPPGWSARSVGLRRQLALFETGATEFIDSLPGDVEMLREQLRSRRSDELLHYAIAYGLVAAKRASKRELVGKLAEYRLSRLQ